METLLERILKEQEQLDWEAACLENAVRRQQEKDLEEELNVLEEMDEATACACYHTDSKAEARQILIEFRTLIA